MSEDNQIQEINNEPVIEENGAENTDTLVENTESAAMETAENLSTENAEKPASETPESKGKVKTIVKKLAKRWFIDAFSGMAMGLFATLIAGTIIYQIGDWSGNNAFGNTLKLIGNFAKTLMGAGIGVGIAHKLNAKPLVVFTAAVCGLLGAWAGELVSALVAGGDYSSLLDGKLAIVFKNGLPGNPIGSYVVALFAIEIAELYAGKTKFDIILIPLGMLLLTFGAIFIAWPFIQLVNLIAKVLVLAVNAGTGVKILTGILVAVVMGILLTMPTSSAAIWIAIATSATAIENPEAFSIAGGAAVAGCAAHMVGFAVASFRENGFGGLISQGLGTSMLQIPNIMKKPVIMVPEIIASAIAGFVAVLFDMRCNASGGGMGTSGLVGVFGVIDASTAAGVMAYKYVLGIVLTMFVIPAFVCFFASEFMRKKGWIVLGDQKLE